MRYERLKDIVDLAIRLQGSRAGVTIEEIQSNLSVSRRTAERMRDAVEWAFGPLETVPSDDNRLHWRLRSGALRCLVQVTTEELSALATASAALERTGLQEQATRLKRIDTKLRAVQNDALERRDSDLEALMQVEGLAMRPGPRQPVDAGLIEILREAILTSRMMKFRYRARSTGRTSHQRLEPYGLIYGNRAFLVARNDWNNEPRLWRLTGMDEAKLLPERFDRDPDFDLRCFARRSFGTFQEDPVQVMLRFDTTAAPDASFFLFHPDQTAEVYEDGTVTVCFEAGGLDEICWHLITWGETVTVERPLRLRRRLAKMCATLAAHHRPA